MNERVTIIRRGTPYAFLNDALCAKLLSPEAELEAGRLLCENDNLRAENVELRHQLEAAERRITELYARTLELHRDSVEREAEPTRRAEHLTAVGVALALFAMMTMGFVALWACRVFAF